MHTVPHGLCSCGKDTMDMCGCLWSSGNYNWDELWRPSARAKGPRYARLISWVRNKDQAWTFQGLSSDIFCFLMNLLNHALGINLIFLWMNGLIFGGLRESVVAEMEETLSIWQQKTSWASSQDRMWVVEYGPVSMVFPRVSDVRLALLLIVLSHILGRFSFLMSGEEVNILQSYKNK